MAVASTIASNVLTTANFLSLTPYDLRLTPYDLRLIPYDFLLTFDTNLKIYVCQKINSCCLFIWLS